MTSFKNFWEILNKKQKKNFLFIIPLLLFGTLLEILSLGMIIPLITSIIAPDKVNLDFLLPLIDTFDLNVIGTNMIVVIVSLVLGVFLFKNFFLVYLYSQFIKFATSLEAHISDSIYTKYLHQPYIFFIKNKSSKLISNLTAETRMFTNSFTIPIFYFINDFLVVISIFILILFVGSKSLIILLLIMGLAGIILTFILRKNVKKWGEIRSHNDEHKISYLEQAIDSIKQTIMQNNQAHFINNFKKHIESNADVTNKAWIVSRLPRVLYEILGIIALSSFILILVFNGKLDNNALIELGFYVAVAYRVVPSLNIMLASYQQLRFSHIVMAIISKELNLSYEKKIDNNKKINFNDSIKISNASFSYPESKFNSLNKINLSIKKGDFIGIKGESGSGKTTLLDIIIGLLDTSEGKLEADGVNINENINNWRNKIGYVPQATLLIDDTIKKNIIFGADAKSVNEDRLLEVIKITKLDKLVRNSINGLDTFVGPNGSKLSGGEKQRIGIARALYLDPEILAMDEPTSSLDTQTENEIIESINNLIGKKTLIVVSHRDSLISRCNKIFNISDGKLIE